jgi:hypothetical protein
MPGLRIRDQEPRLARPPPRATQPDPDPMDQAAGGKIASATHFASRRNWTAGIQCLRGQWIPSRESQSLLRSFHEGRFENALAQEANCGKDQPRMVRAPELGTESASRLGLADQPAKGRLQPCLQPDHGWPAGVLVDLTDSWHRCRLLVDNEIIHRPFIFQGISHV